MAERKRYTAQERREAKVRKQKRDLARKEAYQKIAEAFGSPKTDELLGVIRTEDIRAQILRTSPENLLEESQGEKAQGALSSEDESSK